MVWADTQHRTKQQSASNTLRHNNTHGIVPGVVEEEEREQEDVAQDECDLRQSLEARAEAGHDTACGGECDDEDDAHLRAVTHTHIHIQPARSHVRNPLERMRDTADMHRASNA